MIEADFELAVVVDHVAILPALNAALPRGSTLRVLVDIDPGMGRTGVVSPEQAVATARAIAGQGRLIYGGIQYYCGSDQHIRSLADRRAAIVTRNLRLAQTIAALGNAGLAPEVVTGGGTGTHGIDAELGLLTELQPGSYIFMDSDYGACELGGGGPFEVALTVQASVTSANHAGFATLDAGHKAIAADSGRAAVLAGAPIDSVYSFMGDEHGRLALPEGAAPLVAGTRVTLVTSHCDPTVNLHGIYHLTRGGAAAGVWSAEARGYGMRA